MAGVLAPLFALRTENDLGIGDTDALRQFIDWSAEIGFKLVQLLPVNEIGRDNSPYNAISSVALEPTTLHLAPGSPKDLTAEDFEATLAKFDLPKLRRGNVNYRRVRRLKAELLERAFARFDERRGTDDSVAQDFEEFCRAEAAWLEDYALFRALMERNRGRETWDRWPENHRSLGAARRWLDGLGPKRRTIFETRLRFFRYVQWTAFEQWRAVKNYAEQRGVALMGDVPFGVSYYSADVFAQPELFALEWSGGAPPEPYFHEDEFTQKWGQNWGIPLYNWPEMRARDLAWWRRRVHEVRQFFHLFRIDHVLGFYRIYAFPWRPEHNAEFISLRWEEMRQRTGGREPHFAPRDDQSWENCEANRREGEEYLRVRAGGGGRQPGRRRRSGHRAALCPAESAFVRHRRLQNSTVGNTREWFRLFWPRVSAAVRHYLCDTRSSAAAAHVGTSPAKRIGARAARSEPDLPVRRPGCAQRANELSTGILSARS